MKLTASDSAADATTRQRVLRYVMEYPRATVAQVAGAFGVTPSAIRRHLASLVASGQVNRQGAKTIGHRTPGRPAGQYVATVRGRDTVAHAYDDLAIEALEMLQQVGGHQAVVAFFERRFAGVEARFKRLRTDDPELSDAEALAQALHQDGFAPRLSAVGAGEQLCQHHCPYPAVAARFPELCRVETAVFARLLDSHLQRLATIAHGDGVCTTNIPPGDPGKGTGWA